MQRNSVISFKNKDKITTISLFKKEKKYGAFGIKVYIF